MITDDVKVATRSANLGGAWSACKGTVFERECDFANEICDQIADHLGMDRVGHVKVQGRCVGGSSTYHDDGSSSSTSTFVCKSSEDHARLVISVNTLMEIRVGDLVFKWETDKDKIQAHILPCHLLHNFKHQASSPTSPGCSWVCTLKNK